MEVIVPRDEYERLARERDELADRVRLLEGRAKRDPAREQDATNAILTRLPRGLRAGAVVTVSTMACGDLYATCLIGRRSLGFPQHRLSERAFAAAAAATFASALFFADQAASVPPRGRQ